MILASLFLPLPPESESEYPDAQVLLGWEDVLSALSFIFFCHIPFFYFLLHFTLCVSHSKNPSSALESELLPAPSDFQVWVSMFLSPVFLFPPKLSFEILWFCFLAQRIPDWELHVLLLICHESFHSGWLSHSVKLLLPLEYLLLPLSP